MRIGTTLFIDLDGVMADFDRAFPELFGVNHKELLDDDMWAYINNHGSFFRDLPLIPGARQFFDTVRALNPIILTACPKTNYAGVAKQKREWVHEHLCPHTLVLPVMGSHNKPLFMHKPNDILVDDYGKNIEAWDEAGGRAVKFEGDWNPVNLKVMEYIRQDWGNKW